MPRTWIGAGGWGYFAGGLHSYARAFRFAEVNATFYRHVSDATARRWRASVPDDFTFAVKVHREVTHQAHLRPTAGARASMARDSRVARILRAPFLILETPGSLRLGEPELDGLREFAAMVPDGTRVGLEARGHAQGPLPPAVRRAFEDLGVLDVVDLSRAAPRIEDETVYTRVFGKGAHNLYELDDDELRGIDRARGDAKTVAYAFHGVRMYKDAARFLTFRRTGSFPPATGSVGLDSLAEILAPDVRFPADRDALLRDHGWKVVDVTAERRAHASAFLERLPAGTYENLRGLVATLERREARGRP